MAGTDGEDSKDSQKKHSKVPKKHFEWNDTIRYYKISVYINLS